MSPTRPDARHDEVPHPPGAWGPARRAAKRLIGPVEDFLKVEASSGILLLLAAVVALAWANSPWAPSYEALWHVPIGFALGPWSFERDLHFWVNDGLMAIFFFVVGLEIRREIHRGELSELRRAALPLAAALGGMALPAVIYIALNVGQPSADGWGVPMATDIAFAVGVLALLGKRVAPPLRILLLALAVIDDVGAIVVIAVFYSSGLSWIGLGVVAGGIALILLMQKIGVRSPWAYVLPALVVWGGAYASGVHPTLAGVIIGMLTPVRAWFGEARFLEHAEQSLQAVRTNPTRTERDTLHHLEPLERARREAISPVERLEHALHGWVAYGIMPLFALANAGVALGSASLEGTSLWVFVGVLGGLVVGKPLGVVALSWLATRLGWATLPTGMRWSHVLIVGFAAGIGFTMALFIAGLAFPPGPLLETAKLAILAASGLAGVITFAAGVLWLRGGETVPGVAASDTQAEQSTAA